MTKHELEDQTGPGVTAEVRPPRRIARGVETVRGRAGVGDRVVRARDLEERVM